MTKAAVLDQKNGKNAIFYGILWHFTALHVSI